MKLMLAAMLLGAFLFSPLNADAQVTTSIRISGAVAQPLTLTVEDLKQFPLRRIDDVRAIQQDGRSEERTRRYGGVLLRDVLDRAKLIETQRHDLRRSVVLATASDGYIAVFSWAELYLSAIGDGVLVYYELDGKPLDDHEGRIALASLKDTRPGPRHVRWLQSLEVVRVGVPQLGDSGGAPDPTEVREAGKGLAKLLARRFPPMEGYITSWTPNGTTICELPDKGGFEGQRFEIIGIDEVNREGQRKRLFLLTGYGGNLCKGQRGVEDRSAVGSREKIKSVPVKVLLAPFEVGQGTEAEVAKQLFDETKTALRLIPQFDVNSPTEADLTIVIRVSGPRGNREIRVQAIHTKTGSIVGELDLLGTF